MAVAATTRSVPHPAASGRSPSGVDLLRAYHERGEQAARDELVRRYLPLVHGLVRRYANGSEPLEDLLQTGTIGLLKAIDRFEPGRGVGLACYAIPTITGELRHHARDSGWPVRVPRRIRERTRLLARLEAELAQGLGRAPTIAELAEAAHLSEEAVAEALAAERAGGSVPSASDGPLRLEELEQAAALERGYARSEDRLELAAAARVLDARERRILELRFGRDLTEAEIGDALGISQRRVSQLMNRALEKMRREIAGGSPAGSLADRAWRPSRTAAGARPGRGS